MPRSNSFPIIMLKEIIKGSAIGSSNQATKWAALLARSNAVSDSAARCGITIAGQPDCLYAWHRALGNLPQGISSPIPKTSNPQFENRTKSDIKQIPRLRSLLPSPANHKIARHFMSAQLFHLTGIRRVRKSHRLPFSFLKHAGLIF